MRGYPGRISAARHAATRSQVSARNIPGLSLIFFVSVRAAGSGSRDRHSPEIAGPYPSSESVCC
jgi:hypothetical protein